MNDNLTHKTRPTTVSGAVATDTVASTTPTVQTPKEDDEARGSLLRQAGRAAVLSLASTPALIITAVIERWLSTR